MANLESGISLFVPSFATLRRLITDFVVSVVVAFVLSFATGDDPAVDSAVVRGDTRMTGRALELPSAFCICTAPAAELRCPTDDGPFTEVKTFSIREQRLTWNLSGNLNLNSCCNQTADTR